MYKEGLNGGTLITLQHLIFGLCNMKELNFKRFHTNSKKFTVAVPTHPKFAFGILPTKRTFAGFLRLEKCS